MGAFFATAAEQIGIAAFQADHAMTSLCLQHHQAFDELLRGRLATATLADMDHAGAILRMHQHFRINQVIHQQHIGLGDCLYGLQRQQVGITRPGADQHHLALLFHSLHIRPLAKHHAACATG